MISTGVYLPAISKNKTFLHTFGFWIWYAFHQLKLSAYSVPNCTCCLKKMRSEMKKKNCLSDLNIQLLFSNLAFGFEFGATSVMVKDNCAYTVLCPGYPVSLRRLHYDDIRGSFMLHRLSPFEIIGKSPLMSLCLAMPSTCIWHNMYYKGWHSEKWIWI